MADSSDKTSALEIIQAQAEQMKNNGQWDQVKALFHAKDTNHDGRLSFDELGVKTTVDPKITEANAEKYTAKAMVNEQHIKDALALSHPEMHPTFLTADQVKDEYLSQVGKTGDFLARDQKIALSAYDDELNNKSLLKPMFDAAISLKGAGQMAKVNEYLTKQGLPTIDPNYLSDFEKAAKPMPFEEAMRQPDGPSPTPGGGGGGPVQRGGR